MSCGSTHSNEPGSSQHVPALAEAQAGLAACTRRWFWSPKSKMQRKAGERAWSMSGETFSKTSRRPGMNLLPGSWRLGPCWGLSWHHMYNQDVRGWPSLQLSQMNKGALSRRPWPPAPHSLHSHQQEVAGLWMLMFGFQLQPCVSAVYFNGPRKWAQQTELMTNWLKPDVVRKAFSKFNGTWMVSACPRIIWLLCPSLPQ